MNGGVFFRLGRGAFAGDAESFAALRAMNTAIATHAGEAVFTAGEAAWFARLAESVAAWSTPGAPAASQGVVPYRENLAPAPPRVTEGVRWSMTFAVVTAERMMEPHVDRTPEVNRARLRVLAHVVNAAVALGLGRIVAADDVVSEAT